MAVTKIAVLLLGLAVAGRALECNKINEAVNFEENVCKVACKDNHDSEEFRYRNSEKGGAFSYDCFCGKDNDIEYCVDKDFDVNAMPTSLAWRNFAGLSPMALGAALLAFLKA
jgi:hypothetical protein